MFKRYSSSTKVILFYLSILIGLSSCNVSSSSVESKLTPEDAINSLADLSPTEWAQFIVDNREQYPFLDCLYSIKTTLSYNGDNVFNI